MTRPAGGTPRVGLARHDAVLHGLLAELPEAVQAPRDDTGSPAPAKDARRPKPSRPDATPLSMRRSDTVPRSRCTSKGLRSLSFTIGGQRLALPLFLMHGVCPLPKRLIRVPDRPV